MSSSTILRIVSGKYTEQPQPKLQPKLNFKIYANLIFRLNLYLNSKPDIHLISLLVNTKENKKKGKLEVKMRKSRIGN